MTTQQRTSQVPARPRQWADRPMPEVADVTHRYVETGRLGVHVAEAGERAAAAVAARVAATLVCVAGADPAARGLPAADLPGSSRLRLDRRAGQRLSHGRSRGRHGGAARRARTGPGRCDRAWRRRAGRLRAVPQPAGPRTAPGDARRHAPLPEPAASRATRVAFLVDPAGGDHMAGPAGETGPAGGHPRGGACPPPPPAPPPPFAHPPLPPP